MSNFRRGGRFTGVQNSFQDRKGKNAQAFCVLSVMSDGQDWSVNWHAGAIDLAKTNLETREALFEIARSIQDSLDQLFPKM